MKWIKIALITLAVFTLLLTIVFFIWWAFKNNIEFSGDKFDQVKWMHAYHGLRIFFNANNRLINSRILSH